jgi:CubicO group peptidase (beta-lactamase class C family)
MRRSVLLPLGMTESTFVDPDPAHLAIFFDANGRRAVHYRFTALAAASLYTSTNDMTRFLDAQLKGPRGEPVGRGVLQPNTVELMRHPQASIFGLPIWGLGTVLYAPNDAGGFVVGHDGNNFPAINTTARLDPATGDGIVLLETGNPTVASKIGGDWTFWHTGTVDLGVLVSEARQILMILAGGILVIIVVTTAIFWRGRARA